MGSVFGYCSQFYTRLNPEMHDEMNLVVLVISIIRDFKLLANILLEALLESEASLNQISIIDT